jgi:hypothetical protein
LLGSENGCCYQEEGELLVESIVTGDGTWVYRFKKKLHDFETSSFTLYKTFKIGPSAKNRNNGNRVLGL